MDNLFIFGAKYLFIVSIFITLVYFWKSTVIVKKKMFAFSLISLPTTFVIGKLANFFYYNPRPFVVDNFKPLIEHANDNGFPSDHTLLLAGLASLMVVFNRKLGCVLWTITFLVGFSRVYVGVHHPIDVLASVIISTIVGGMIYFLGKNKINAS